MTDERTPQRTQQSERPVGRRLMQEINLLKLEGSVFCFDPREARRRGGVLTLADALKRPVTIRVHPELGQPSVLAYKVLQAIFLKLSEQGCEPTEDGLCLYSESVSFSQRELARLVGRAWGTSASEQLYQAIKQLQLTEVSASLYDKKVDEWSLSSFVILPSILFSGRGKTISRCAVRLASEVRDSLNRRHVAFFNLHRLNKLDTLGLVLYKHVFFHLSNLMHEKKNQSQLKFTKDYEAICHEWLGDIKVLSYRSRIINDQLGRHLDGLISTGLIRRHAIEKNKAGDGFNISFFPAAGFFEDYEEYYVRPSKPRRLAQVAELQEVKALELVAHFHRSLGRTARTRFEDHETAYADELLATHSEADVRDLIAYAIREGARTKFDMLWFGSLKRYLPEWSEDNARAKERARKTGAVQACPFCNEGGFLELKEEGSSRVFVHPCPHQIEQVAAIEDRLRAYRRQPPRVVPLTVKSGAFDRKEWCL